MLAECPTIADRSLVDYLYYPPDEFGFDVAADHKHIAACLDRIKAPGGSIRCRGGSGVP